MRHRVSGKQLCVDKDHRRAMLRNLAAGLFEHGQIVTTPAKAKAAPTKPVVSADLEPLQAVPAPAEAQPVAKPARKPRTPKVVSPEAVPVLPTEPADSPAAPTPKARKPRTKTTVKAGDE